MTPKVGDTISQNGTEDYRVTGIDRFNGELFLTLQPAWSPEVEFEGQRWSVLQAVGYAVKPHSGEFCAALDDAQEWEALKRRKADEALRRVFCGE